MKNVFNGTKLRFWRLSAAYVVLLEQLQFCFKPKQFPFWLRHILRDEVKRAGSWIMNECMYITVPAGFVCDLASIPTTLRWLFRPDGKWAQAAAIHDFLYGIHRPVTELNTSLDGLTVLRQMLEFKLASRKYCDAIFYMAMRASGVNPIIATGFYMAVRVAGWQFFNSGRSIPVEGLLLTLNATSDVKRTYHYKESAIAYSVFSTTAKRYPYMNDADVDHTIYKLPNLPTPLLLS